MIFSLDPNLNTILISIIMSLVMIIYKEHKILYQKIIRLEKRLKKLERRFNDHVKAEGDGSGENGRN